MAKNDLDVEDLGDMDNFDMPEFGDDNLGDNIYSGLRSALPAPAITFANAIKDEALSVGQLRRSVLKVLPLSYSDAYELGDMAYGDLNEVYSQSKEKLKPEVDRLKKTLKRAVPLLSGILPESMNQWLDEKLSVEESSYRTPTQEQMDTTQIQGALNSIFAAQSQQEAVKQDVELAKTAEQEHKEDVRTEYMGGIQKATYELINKLVSYQDRITSNYQRQSLELQFKQFFVSRDLLKVSQATFKDALQLLKSISHNTFIPDSLKETNVEAYQNLVRERIFGSLSEPVTEFAGKMFDQFRDNVKQGLLDIVQKTAGQISQLTGGLDAFLSVQEQQTAMAEQMGETPQSYTDMGIDLAATGVATGVSGKVRARLERWLKQKAKEDPRVTEWYNKLSYWLRNKESFLLDAKREPHLELGRFEFLKDAVEWLQDRIPSFSGEREKIKADLYETSYQKVDFDKITRRSIIEIIPGFLSRILQQVTITNTGNKETARLVYDVRQERFQSMAEVQQKVDQQLVSAQGQQQIKNQMDRFFEVVDPEQSLSAEAKTALTRQLLRNTDRMERFNPFDYTKKRDFQGDISDEALNEITELMKARFVKTDTLSGVKETALLNKADQLVVGLRSSLPELQSTLNKMVAGGQAELLQDSGWITANNQLNFARYFDALAGLRPDSADEPMPADSAEGSGGWWRGLLGRLGGGGTVTSAGSGSMNVQLSLLREIKGKLFDLYDWLIQPKEVNRETTSFRLENRFSGEGNASDPSTAQNLLLGIWQNTGRMAEGPLNQNLTDMLGSINTSLLALSGTLTNGEILRDRSILRTAGEGLSRWIRSAGTMMAQGYGAIGSGFDWLREGFQKGVAGLRQKPVLTIYITGEEEPVLTARRLRQQRYLDVKTNKIVSYVEDITGPVVDIEDNYNEMISQDDFGKGLFARDSEGKLSVVGGKLLDLGSTLIGGYTDIAKKVFELPGQAVDMASRFYRGITIRGDLYLPGSDKVVLSARILRAGGYVDANGQPIYGLDDIKTDIFNKKGELVLALEDITQGLFYRDGKRADLRGLMERLGASVRSASSWAWSKATVVSKALWSGLKGVGRRITGQYKIERAPLQTFHDDFPPEDMDSKLRVMIQIRDLVNIGLGDKKQSLIDSALSGAGAAVGQAVSAVGTVLGTPWRMVVACKDYLMEKMGNILPESVIDTLAERMAGTKEEMKKKKEQWRSRFRRTAPEGEGASEMEEMADNQARGTTILDDIRTVLTERLERPEQIRAGSWQEKWRARREQGQASASRRGERIRRRMGMGAATAATTSTEEEEEGLLDTAQDMATEKIIESGLDALTGGGDEGDDRAATARGEVRPERRRDKLKRWGRSAWTTAKGAGLALGGMVFSGGSLATAGATAVSAIGALLSAPVLATGALLAGGAYAGYKAYQWFTDKDLRKPVQGEMEAYRLRQYGFDPESEDRRVALRVMENTLWDEAELDARGHLVLDGTFQDYYDEFYEVCTLEEGNIEQAQKWAYWFRDRFLPVLERYKRQCSLLKISSLAELEQLKDEDKLNLLQKTSPGFNDMLSPYRIMSTPFGTLDAYPTHVLKGFFTDLVQAIEKRITTETASKEKTPEEEAPLAEPAPVVKIKGLTAPARLEEGISSKVSLTIKPAAKRATPRAGSWEEYRFGQYGFIEASIEQTKVLRVLEAEVSGLVQYAKDGEVSLNNARPLFEKLYKAFGLDKSLNVHSNIWLSWFSQRFFPVFKRYAQFCSQFALATFDDLENLQDREQATQLLFNVSTFPALHNPYSWLSSPFVLRSVLAKEEAIKTLASRKLSIIQTMALQHSVSQPGHDALDPRQQSRAARVAAMESSGSLPATPPPMAAMTVGEPPKSHFQASLPQALSEGDQRVDFINPVNAPISSRVGTRSDPFTGRSKTHKGIDYAAPTNTPIVASGDGVIERVATTEGFGNVIEIRHANGLYTRYAHMNGFADGMKKGLTVTQGQLIGFVGSTGRSTGPHLHFEMRSGLAQKDTFFDPERLLGKVTASPSGQPAGVEVLDPKKPSGGDSPEFQDFHGPDHVLARKAEQVALQQRTLELQRTDEMHRGLAALEGLQGVLGESLMTQKGIEQLLKIMSQTLGHWSPFFETSERPATAETALLPAKPVTPPMEPKLPPVQAPVSWKRRLATT